MLILALFKYIVFVFLISLLLLSMCKRSLTGLFTSLPIPLSVWFLRTQVKILGFSFSTVIRPSPLNSLSLLLFLLRRGWGCNIIERWDCLILVNCYWLSRLLVFWDDYVRINWRYRRYLLILVNFFVHFDIFLLYSIFFNFYKLINL